MNISSFFQKHTVRIVFFCLIFIVGIFLRSYHFSDWLHFEIDQSYDIALISPAVENGISHLPLLGPTAGGGRALRLGPAFYYLEYLSGTVFGNTPVGYAMLILILSIASLPLFYLFCKRYFTEKISLGLMAIFSVSLYLVLYSRFSWSPNVLPFFILLAFYSLLRAVSLDEPKKDYWFLVATFSLAILTQIHFNAFFVVPPIVGIFLILKRPHFSWGTWVMALGIFFLVYTPMIVSDIQTNGENAKFFLEKINKGGFGGSLEYNTVKFVQTLQYYASETFLIDTGIDHINDGRMRGYGFANKTDTLWRVGALLLFFLQCGLLVVRLRKETDTKKKDFLWLCSLWLGITFLYFFSLERSGFRLFPRFFLLISPLSIVLLGFLVERFTFSTERRHLVFLIVFFASVCLLNLGQVALYFQKLEEGDTKKIIVETEDVLPNVARVTLAQQLAITEYIESKYQENSYPVYLKTVHEYEDVLWYHLAKGGIVYYDSFARNDAFYRQGNYFVVQFPAKRVPKISGFTIAETQSFGTLVVYYLKVIPEMVTEERQVFGTGKTLIQKDQVAKINTWKSFFSHTINK